MKPLFILFLSICFAWGAAFVSPAPAFAMGFHASAYWCDNANYPMVRSHMGYDQYDDLSSAYVAQEWSDQYTTYKVCVCNIIGVDQDTNQVKETYVARVLIGEGEDGPSFYRRDGNKWVEIGSYGYTEALYNTGWVLLHYFSGSPI